MGNQSSGPKVTAQDRAILDLKLQRDKVRQYQKKIEGILERERQLAKAALAAGNKDRALLALRRRKYQEQLLVKTDTQLETLQRLVSSIEFSLVEKDVLFGLRQGNAVLRELNAQMSVDSVEKLMGETADAVAYQREVNELLSSRITADDEEAVQAEFEQLQAEAHASRLPALDRTRVQDPVSLPDSARPEPERVAPPEAEPEPQRVAMLA